MDTLTAVGSWWLPDSSPSTPVLGTLKITPNRIELILQDAFDSATESPVIASRKLELVHGQLADDRFVTLVGAEQGPALRAPRVRAQFCLLGPHLANTDRITHAVVEFDALDPWIDQPHIDYADDIAQVARVGVGQAPLCEASVDGDRYRLLSGFVDMDSRPPSLVRRTSMEITFDEPRPLFDLLSVAVRPFQDFLTVCIGRPVAITAVKVVVDDLTPTEWRLPHDLYCPIHQYVVDPTTDRQVLWAATPLLDATGFLGAFPELLPAWYSVRDEYSGTVSNVNAPFYARFMYLENRAAIAVQAVESWIRAKDGNTKEKSAEDHAARVKAVMAALDGADLDAPTLNWARGVLQGRNDKSLKQQIAELLSESGDLGISITASLPEFAAQGAVLRHRSSHGAARAKVRKPDEYTRDHLLTNLVIGMLRVSLLGLAGVSPGLIDLHYFDDDIKRLAELSTKKPGAKPS